MKNRRFRIDGWIGDIVITSDTEMRDLTVNKARRNPDTEDEIEVLQALALLGMAALGNATSGILKNEAALSVKEKDVSEIEREPPNGGNYIGRFRKCARIEKGEEIIDRNEFMG